MRNQVLSRRILDLYQRGYRPVDVAAAVNCSSEAVYSIIRESRRRGEMPKASAPRVPVPDVVMLLTDREAFWLMKQIPKGSTMTEVIAAIIKDAFAEERAKVKTA